MVKADGQHLQLRMSNASVARSARSDFIHRSLLPTESNSVYEALGTEVYGQMFWSGASLPRNPHCLVPKQAWYSFCSPTDGMKCLVDLGPAWDLSPGPVV
ncbi:hypothetical protein TNCV_1402351 [Trichonephila clavipes]|nr:hypothetical protein TNCV_1402351 [Trichonephila clavipes]